MQSGQAVEEAGPTVRAPPINTPTPELENALSSDSTNDTLLVDQEELKLPKTSSLIIVVVANLLLQVRQRPKKNLS